MSSRMTGKNIACTGTIRMIFLRDCPVKAVKEMQKTAGETFDFDTYGGFTWSQKFATFTQNVLLRVAYL